MIRGLIGQAGLALCLLASGPAAAQTLTIPEIPEISVTVSPDRARRDGWFVQGQLIVTVRIAAKTAFEELDFQMPKFADADIVELRRPTTRRVKSYAGTGFVLETVIAVFPRKPGKFRIPPIRARGRVVSPKGREIRFDDRTDPVSIEVAGIDPSYTAAWWLVAPRVEIAERWSKPLHQARLGDVLRREVTVTAFGATADRIRIPEHRRTRFVQIADRGRTARTEISAEGVVGIVTRAWDLKIENSGVVYIGAVGVDYWNPVTREAARATVIGRRIEPLPADARAVAAALMAEARAADDRIRALALSVLFLLLAPVAALGGAAGWLMLPTGADLRLARICRSQPGPADLYRAITEWRSVQSGATPAPEAVRAAQLQLFGRRDEPLDACRVCSALLRTRRRERLRGAMNWLRRLLETMFCRRTRLVPK